LTFEQDEVTQSIGLLSTSLFNMSKLAQASLNDSAIFLDLGAIIEAKFQKLDLDFNKFSIKTVEMILTFVNPVIIILTVIGLHTFTPAFPSTQCSSGFNSTSKSERFAPAKQTLGTQLVEDTTPSYRTTAECFYDTLDENAGS
jgi:hypothetical protein